MGFRLGELFCGPGGLALGAVTADIGFVRSVIQLWRRGAEALSATVVCGRKRRGIGFGERWKGV